MITSEATAPRRKLYPRHIEGRFRRLRNLASGVLQALLFLAPWIQWRGQQAILLDLPGRRLFFFDLVLHPQETYFLMLLAILGALCLFASTALGGRMWCGYACPQTLFTQSFIAVERFFEGDRAARIRLDKGPWDTHKVSVKVAKWTVWTMMGAWLGVTFAGYYIPIRDLVANPGSGQALIVVALFMGISLFDFGWFREQFCCYLCPYARFQGSMLDSHSRIVGYDFNRGEPRGKATDKSAGGCVNCTMCVQVCPMGIDIRNGLQLECIACTACIDACNETMDKLGRPQGLIRYTSLQELEGKKTSLVRPRVVIYGVLLGLLSLLFVVLLARRGPMGFDVIRQNPGGGQNFSVTADGRVSNAYRVHLVNHTRQPQTVALSLEGFPDAELVTPSNPYSLAPAEVASVTVVILHSRQNLAPLSHFRLHARAGSLNLEKETTFLAPFQ